MTMITKKEVLLSLLEAYPKASREEKRRILDIIVETIGMKRSAITQAFSRMRKLDPWKSPPWKRGQKQLSGPDTISALRTV